MKKSDNKSPIKPPLLVHLKPFRLPNIPKKQAPTPAVKYMEPTYDMFTDKYDLEKSTKKYHEKPQFL